MLRKILAITALCLSLPVFALDAAKEYEIKAAFLFNLGSFITWPESAFENAATPFHICVLGTDPFGEILDVITTDQTVSGHPVIIRRLHDIAEATHCEVVFISQSEQPRIQAIFNALSSQPVLTVSDMDDFVLRGGMVQFFPLNNKIRLMLAPEAFSEAGLKASAHLMRIAQLKKGK